ncbi:hypothetical protein ABT173_26500 [Streptomyces sp. NPDC001795]|uniref:hypothetical protein n=1 Tax=unclassified Streptomyces TaxID=2593676 RepID=UPI003330A9B6
MTSLTHVTRRQARIALAAAGLTAALVLTGCSSDSGDNGSGGTSTPSASASTAGTGGSASPSAKPGKLEGSWLATTSGKAVALVITGKEAALFTTGGTVCSGTAGEEAGMQMIHLKCTDGSKNRSTGMVDSVNSKGMKVTWSGGSIGTETYVKSEGGKMPSGLPTASLGS